jgi:hypothetical protein
VDGVGFHNGTGVSLSTGAKVDSAATPKFIRLSRKNGEAGALNLILLRGSTSIEPSVQEAISTIVWMRVLVDS